MNITLIGMAGVGKSTVGKALAKKLNCRFIDVDKFIEEETGMKLQEFIDEFGEERFKAVEEQTLLMIGRPENTVISPGGSIIYSDESMKMLKRISKVVYLHDSFENIEKVIKNPSTRGIIGLKRKSLREIYDERLPLYRKYADITIEMPKEFKLKEIVGMVLEKVETE